MNTRHFGFGPTSVLLGLVIITFANSRLVAQTKLENPQQYREEKQAAIKLFFDRTAEKAARVEAAKKIGYPTDAVFARMLKLIKDPDADDDIRWEAARRHRFDEVYIDTVLSVLENAANGDEELNAKLIADISRRTVTVQPPQIRQRVQKVLRELLEDPRDSVRLSAFRALVPSNDTVAIKRLVDQLKSPEDPSIPLADAIDLLDLAGSVNHVDVLRPFLKHENPKIQAQAAKALSVDPVSRPQIIELLTNLETDKEVRLLALRALAREDDGYADYAIGLIESTTESTDFRHAALKAFMGRMNYQQVEATDQIKFAQAIEKLSAIPTENNRSLENLKSTADKLLPMVKQRFPAIRTFYENRDQR